MRWGDQELWKLKALAERGLSAREIAGIMGATVSAIYNVARKNEIALCGKRGPTPLSDDEKLRRRWGRIMPGILAAVREDMRRIMS